MGRVVPRRGPVLPLALDPAGSSAWAVVPRDRAGAAASVDVLAAAARRCRACPLWEPATQTVFGEGPARAPLMLVGEQPGDAEDRQGHPFVGPAGALLSRALDEAGIDRAAAYVTNAVKHFNFVRRGAHGKRIHAKPKARDVKACQGWLIAELQAVRPRVVVCLGATAAQSLLGPHFRLTRQRGQILSAEGDAVGAVSIVATYHPSALLRAPDEQARHAMRAALVADLRAAAGAARLAAAVSRRG